VNKIQARAKGQTNTSKATKQSGRRGRNSPEKRSAPTKTT